MSTQKEQETIDSLTIREASPSDLPEIESVLRDTIQTPYGSGFVGKEEEVEIQMELSRIRNSFESPDESNILITESNEGVKGFAYFGPPDSRITDFMGSDPATTLELRLLYLHQAARIKGIGSKLLHRVEQEALKNGKQRVELTSGPRFILIGTGTFYLKSGYTRVGTINNYFEDKFPAWVFQKNLASDQLQ